MDYEAEDKGILAVALVALGVCPKCRRPLRMAPGSYFDEGLACVTCDELWPFPAGWPFGGID